MLHCSVTSFNIFDVSLEVPLLMDTFAVNIPAHNMVADNPRGCESTRRCTNATYRAFSLCTVRARSRCVLQRMCARVRVCTNIVHDLVKYWSDTQVCSASPCISARVSCRIIRGRLHLRIAAR